MIGNMKKSECCGCGACYNICPKKAIEMIEDEEGFKYPKINEEKCVKCGLCEKICPSLNSQITSRENVEIKTIGTYSNDLENRNNSSSGGIFSELARYIIEEKNGVVYGAGFDEKFKVIQQEISKTKNLEKLRGSKYVQSDTLETYSEVKEYLEKGKYVLYTGTPCQIMGLKSYLRKTYDRLYTCDIICHGVPSPKVFRKYIYEMENEYQSKVTSISFRNKKYGWNIFSMKIEFENGKEYIAKLTEDKFMQGFLKNIYLRPSCYKCKFSTLPRNADISIGDFWGVEKKYEEFRDDKGTSILLLNTNKGYEIFDKIKSKVYYKENCDLEFAIENNPCICGHVEEPKTRKNFFKKLDEESFDKLIIKSIKKPNKIKKIILLCLSKGKRMLKK